MHTRTALLCFSLATCAFCAGQDKAPAARPALPNHVKLVEGFAQFNESKPGKVWAPAQNPVSATNPTCAHIVLIPVPQHVDPKMILKVPDPSASKMPIYKGLPVCPGDLR
ncbi:MAG: hypothetical protein HY822_06425 [Acidobacteria bacterium]|nr:hypothetical protein [Acidobacteriota bacterium]